MRRALIVLGLCAVVLAKSDVAHATPVVDDALVDYRPPVDAELTDAFRPPTTPYGPGNRGIDYATTEGQPVGAAADGEVVFAGRIGSSSHVTVLHADGLRTSYSFLATTTVRRGDRVRQGDTVGAAGAAPGLHFGARAGETYVDPLALFAPAPTATRRAWLVDDPDPTEPLTEAEERDLVRQALRELARRATHAVQQKVDLARILLDDAIDLGIPMPVHLALAAAALQADLESGRCVPGTGDGVPPAPTPQPGRRRIVILVGGLGSATGRAAVLDTDTAGLGYARDDVHQFSYRPDHQPYRPTHTQGDIGAQGRRLAADIADLQRQHPGTPVDVIAHSQGGLVARSAITTHRAAPTTVVTLGTPHQGSDLATAGTAIDLTSTGHLVLEAADAATTAADAGADTLDLNDTSIRQMAETSEFITSLPEHGWDPRRTHVVSIAARADPIVPNHQSRLHGPDAYNTVVTPHGTTSLHDHSTLPGSPEATAEIRRALERQPPICRTLHETLEDAFVGHRTSDLHDSVGATLAAGGIYADHRTRQALRTR